MLVPNWSAVFVFRVAGNVVSNRICFARGMECARSKSVGYVGASFMFRLVVAYIFEFTNRCYFRIIGCLYHYKQSFIYFMYIPLF